MPPLPQRRDLLRLGSLAFGGLSLPSLLAQSSSRERACIVIFQNGGASQLDFFDPKPDAPHDIRGSFGSVPTPLPRDHITHHHPPPPPTNPPNTHNPTQHTQTPRETARKPNAKKKTERIHIEHKKTQTCV